VSQQIQIEITTENGKAITPFSYLTISQQFNGHHYFELRFNHDVLESRNAVLIDKTKDFLGKTITFSMKTKGNSSYPDNIFKGIVTEIGISNSVGTAGDIIFKGFSPTILMEAGQHDASYTQVNLGQIVKEAVSGIPSNLLSPQINPKFKSTIPYIVQYQETAFEFTRRLAAEYGEWFFYDGSNFHFGKPSNGSSIELKFPRDISDLNLNVKVAPLKFEQTDYYSKIDEKFTSASSSVSVPGLDSFGDYAVKASDKLFDKPVAVFASKKAISKSELDLAIKAEKSSRAASLVYLNATSDSPYVKPGVAVKVISTKADKKTNEDFGKFLVLSVTHATDGLGNYHNTFEAIPSTIEVVPNNFDKPPSAEPQLAVVKYNNDPDHLGRIRVQLLWQKDKEMTPWIRVMSFHSGTRGNGDKNRGFFFMPEVGDYVLVGFTQNDPNRPFVMGSVPHGKAIDSSKNNDNNIKAIRTRSGNTIYFKDKDKDKEQEIVIKTDDQNVISILLKNNEGTVSIKSNKDITVTSEKTVTVKSEKIALNGKTITLDASEKVEIKAQTINIEGSQKLSAKSMDVKIEGSTAAKLSSSAKVDIEAGAIASIKGGIVKIN
jgi:type VI secretion system secreted protein VgrG